MSTLEINKSDLCDFNYELVTDKVQVIKLEMFGELFEIVKRGYWELSVQYSPITFTLLFYDKDLRKVIERLTEIVNCK